MWHDAYVLGFETKDIDDLCPLDFILKGAVLNRRDKLQLHYVRMLCLSNGHISLSNLDKVLPMHGVSEDNENLEMAQVISDDDFEEMEALLNAHKG